MKQYSINDLKEGDIYKHIDGGHYEVILISNTLKTVLSKRVNDPHSDYQTHFITDVEVIYSKINNMKKIIKEVEASTDRVIKKYMYLAQKLYMTIESSKPNIKAKHDIYSERLQGASFIMFELGFSADDLHEIREEAIKKLSRFKKA